MNYKKNTLIAFSCFILHTFMSKKYPDIKKYDGKKFNIVHSDCIFGPKDINIKCVDIFIKNIKK